MIDAIDRRTAVNTAMQKWRHGALARAWVAWIGHVLIRRASVDMAQSAARRWHHQTLARVWGAWVDYALREATLKHLVSAFVQ